MISAIPTRYKNIQFRSRLEARWAAFFDQLGWSYLYEPIDLEGYIPDFILEFPEPLLVEVKPVLKFDEFDQHTKKIDQSGWDKDSLIVGAKIFIETCWGTDHPTLGLMTQNYQIVECSNRECVFYGEIASGNGTGKCQSCNQDVTIKSNHFWWSEGSLFHCTECRKFSIVHTGGSWHCITTAKCASGKECLGLPIDAGFDIEYLWNEAGNITQWNP